ncbi:Wings apart-like protein homolog 1 [Caenorhabditis elegans]|uniref:Wings apart-like protein homolog 1 n=2 Tax=Caenorhabditis elegans TaxID=6239 RepID=WAPL_CAEEL|nr:Wings apart-like protein homolog 1 [Caenorhabditis elegans]H2L0H5.1 RecName: Full=Wings apart-like protein homolog 1 [Caenorhabditis elegans]CCD73092.1 Wings apart-like protein homolog 1 [Caenorhabditis elegans]|eukprot:NP_500566.1 Wings apart-like protein homolog 1 [Caenorhabditis elegans]
MSSDANSDDPFSKPIVRKRFQATLAQQGIEDDQLPSVRSSDSPDVPDTPDVPVNQLSSPPLSLPETLSEGNAETLQNLSDDSEPEMLSQSSTSSLNRRMEDSAIDPSRGTRKSQSRGFDYDPAGERTTAPVQKKKKDEIDMGGAKFFPKQEKKHVYTHKWTTEEDDEDEKTISSSSNRYSSRPNQPAVSARPRQPVYATTSTYSKPLASGYGSRVRHIKEANELRESGEYDDFKQDLVYILSSLQSSDASMKVKCLSAISLAKKCVSPDFRQFIKSENMTKSIVKALMDSPEDDLFALAASTVLYLLTRDFNSIKIDFPSLRLVSQLLRIEKFEQRPEDKDKVVNMVWEVFNSYIEKQEVGGQKVSFDMRKESLTPSSLIIEALVFICSRSVNDDNLKSELLNLGILQFVVAKIETNVNLIADNADDTYSILILNRCFRILESSSVFHKKNQAFLISHRSNILISSLAKFLQVILDRVHQLAEEEVKKYISCLALMCRLLINISHDNELCCSKLGQIEGFLPNAITTFTYLAPKFGKENSYDINVMMTSLLTNLVERCNANRKVLIAQTVKMVIPGHDVEEVPALEAITRLFVYHESQAQIVDADLDRELAFDEGGCGDEEEEEEGGDESSDEDGVRKDGRLDRNKMDRMDQVDVVHALQQVMNKASAHMEGSVIASYHALLVGFVLQQNEDHLDEVRKHLPGKNFQNMISQLKRLYDFTKATMAKRVESNSGFRAIERVIEYLERLE